MTVPASHPAAPPQTGPRLLTGGEQSRLSWARVPESPDEVPAAYRAWLDPLMRGRQAFPYIVLTPTYEGYFHRENEKLVCLLQGALHIVERTRDLLTPVSYRLDDISAIEAGSILLRGWLTVRGMAESGLLTSTTLRYNTVTERLFAPFLREFRTGSHLAAGPSLDRERAKFDELVSRNYKFMNFSRSSILPGEEVLRYVLQPEIRDTLVRLFGRSLSRCISPTHTLILTDRELIAISEESGSIWQSFGTVRYGGIWQYVPLTRVSAAAVTMRDDGLLRLSIHLPHDDRLEMLFSPSSGSEVDLLVERLESLILVAPTRRG
jgi:hypothetical protein